MKNLKIPMMILLGLLFSCHPVNAKNYFASKPVICGLVEDVVNTSKGFGEIPILKGEGLTMNKGGALTPSQYVIAFNRETKTWTLIEFLSTGQACVLGTGTEMKFYEKDEGIRL